MTSRRSAQQRLTVALLAAAACAPNPPAAKPAATARDPLATDRCHAPQPPYSTFELAVLGSGGPSSVGRGASSYAVFVDGAARILVDVGPGAFVRLGEMGVDLERLDTLLVTHMHADHAGDLPNVVMSRDLSLDEPLTFHVFGPKGGGDYPSTTAAVELLLGPQGAFRYLAKFRNELRFEVADLPTQADAPPAEVVRGGDLHVTSIAVDHGDTPAVAYRIEHGGHALVVSGDLASKNDNLAHLAAGADLLVYDTTVLDPPASPKPLYALHTPPRRIGEIAAAARVKSLLLSHLTPSVVRAKDQVLASVHADYAGETRMAEDCMRVDLTKL